MNVHWRDGEQLPSMQSTPLLQDAIMDCNLAHRQMAESAMKNMALGVAGSRYKHALNHLVNFVWPNTFENLSMGSNNMNTSWADWLVRSHIKRGEYDATPWKSWRFPCKEKPYNPSRKTDTLGFCIWQSEFTITAFSNRAALLICLRLLPQQAIPEFVVSKCSPIKASSRILQWFIAACKGLNIHWTQRND